MSSFCTATHIFFQQKHSAYCISLDVNFNKSLTNDIVSFEQLGPGGFGKLFDQITRSWALKPAGSEIQLSLLYGASLLRAFHYHPFTDPIWLK